MNSVIIKDAFPVPDVKDALDSLRGAKYFATIDLLSGYWQLGMTQRYVKGLHSAPDDGFISLPGCPSACPVH